MPHNNPAGNMENAATPDRNREAAPPKRRLATRFFGVFSALTILVAAGAISFYLVTNKPRTTLGA